MKQKNHLAEPLSDSLNLWLLQDLVGYHLQQAEIASYRKFIKIFTEHKLTPRQCAVLILIGENPGISQIDIGTVLGMDRATTMSVVDLLQDRHLLLRRRSTTDRRKHALYLTKKCAAQLESLKKKAVKHDKHITSGLTEKEIEQLKKMLIKIQQATS